MAPSSSSSPEQPGFTIGIIGGGLAGLTLSIALTHHHVPHKIYEAAKAFSEIGAGIAMGPNSVLALSLIDPRLRECFMRCATYNEREEDRRLYFGIRNGMSDAEGGEGDEGFRCDNLITSTECQSYGGVEKGRCCVHRANFLNELLSLVADDVAEFNKRVVDLQQDEDRVEISFEDGTTARHSAVVSCDGIKSLGRKFVLGAESSDVAPVFTGEFAYRNLFARSVANEIMGKDVAGMANVYCGHNTYVVMYPVDHGELVSMTACVQRKDMVWDDEEWTAPTSREAMLEDFSGWGEPIRQLLGQINSSDRWALFDQPPAKTYCTGRMCLIGDSAHASTPHQGAGAGMGFEDAYVLSSLLGEVKSSDQITAAFRAYDAVRRPRTQKLVRTSREAGALYYLSLDGVGADLSKVKKNVDVRHTWIWEEDLRGEVREATQIMNDELAVSFAMRKDARAEDVRTAALLEKEQSRSEIDMVVERGHMIEQVAT